MEWQSYPVVDQIQLTEIITFFKSNCEKQYEFKGESHDFWECLYVVSGSLCVSADECVYELREGDIIFHKPLEFHKFYITSETGAEILVFSFKMNGSISGFFADKVFRLSVGQKDILIKLIEYMEEKYNKSGCYMTEYDRYVNILKNSAISMQKFVVSIYRLMLSLFEESSVEKTSDLPETIVFRKAVEFMNDNIHGNPSVNEIAEHCNVSVSGLKRIFNQYAGIGVHKYFLLMLLIHLNAH